MMDDDGQHQLNSAELGCVSATKSHVADGRHGLDESPMRVPTMAVPSCWPCLDLSITLGLMMVSYCMAVGQY